MSQVHPETLADLVAARAEHPDWLLVAGGTDVMVPINFGRHRPPGIIDASRVAGLQRIEHGADEVRLGAGVTFQRLERELRERLPALATTARAVASPQIRAAATIGGNLGTASPAGDAHPFLLASDAVVELVSPRGRRAVPCTEFFLAPGRSVREVDEVISSVTVPLAAGAGQQFSKVGPRNAMVIAVASLALVIDWSARTVGVGLGSVGPTPLRAREAELFLTELLWSTDTPAEPSAADAARFAALVAGAARPIDDVRGTADYRRHVVGLMAGRCLRWVLDDHRRVVPV